MFRTTRAREMSALLRPKRLYAWCLFFWSQSDETNDTADGTGDLHGPRKRSVRRVLWSLMYARGGGGKAIVSSRETL